MFSRRTLFVIIAGFLGVMAMTWWAGSYPAQLTIINTSGGDLAKVSVTSGQTQFEIATIANGEFRRFKLASGQYVQIRCGGKTWMSEEKLTPAQSLVVYILPGGKIEPRSKLGTLAR